MGIPTYETLNILHNEIKSNATAVHSNLGGGQHGYLGLVAIPTACALLTNDPFFCQVHPRNPIIPIADTRHTQDNLNANMTKTYENRTPSQCNITHRPQLTQSSIKPKIFYNTGNWIDPCTPISIRSTMITYFDS